MAMSSGGQTNERGPTSVGPAPAVSGVGFPDLSARLVDAFFRRWALYLAPVVLFALIGAYVASTTPPDYESRGALNASANPLVEQPEIRGGDFGQYESPAAGTARLIDEQLRTDAFVDDVLARIGLDEAVATGSLDRDDFRQQVGASANGENILAVTARWGDPETAFAIVDATITGYLDYVTDVVATDSEEAARFWQERLDAASTRVDDAQAAFDDYSSSLPAVPAGQDQPSDEVFELTRLSAAIDKAQGDVDDAQDRLDEAELTAQQARNAAEQQLRVVDPPEVPLEPEGDLVRRLVSFLAFTAIGLIIAFAALLFSTVTDRTVRTSGQLAAAARTDVTAVVPQVKSLSTAGRAKRSRRRSSRSAA